MKSPSFGTASNGNRAPTGQFLAGNRFATGHRASKAAQLRIAALEAISETDIVAVVRSLVGAAVAGDVSAAKLLLTWIGKPEGDATTENEINEANFERVKHELLANTN